MGFTSVCYEYVLLALVNKKAALTQYRGNIVRSKIKAEIEEERKMCQGYTTQQPKEEDSMYLLKLKNTGNLLVSHSLVIIHRLIEMG